MRCAGQTAPHCLAGGCYPCAILTISTAAARLLLLSAQGLLAPPARAARKADVLAAIRRMRLLQIDTIHIVARSPYLVLLSRLGPYEPRWLDETHAAGKLFEYWSHAMCWLPIEDYPLFGSLIAHNLRYGESYWNRIQDWLSRHAADIEHVRERIRAEGGLRSADFQPPPEAEKRPASGWWDWKVEKKALEYLFASGELMVARREKFQRVYDLRERLLPHWNAAQVLPLAEVRAQLLSRSALALGPATEAWLRDYYRLKNPHCRDVLAGLLDSSTLLPVRIEGVKGQAYLHKELLPLLHKAESGKLAARRTALLSPFDPLVWDRRRARDLFNFDYTIEVYTPEHKRRYGYFSMPILQRERLIGRLDPKAHRRDGVFELRALHLEAGVRLDMQDWEELAAELQACADWHGTHKVVVASSDPPGAANSLRKALTALRH